MSTDTRTVQITETVLLNYQEQDGVMVDCSTTRAVILDKDGEEVEGFGGPVSEEWLEGEWDAALVDAGWRRVSDWNVSEGTAQVVIAE